MIRKNKSILKWWLLSLTSFFSYSFASVNLSSCNKNSADQIEPIIPDDDINTKSVSIFFNSDNKNAVDVDNCSLSINEDGEIPFALNKYCELDYVYSFYQINDDSTAHTIFLDDPTRDIYISSVINSFVIKKDLLKETFNAKAKESKITFNLVCKQNNKDLAKLTINASYATDTHVEGINYYPSDKNLKNLEFKNSLFFDRSQVSQDANGNNIMKIVTAIDDKSLVMNNDSLLYFSQIIRFNNGNSYKIDQGAEYIEDIVVDKIDDSDGLYGNERNYSIFTINFGQQYPYGDIQLPIYEESLEWNVDYWYTCQDENERIIFLRDKTIESDDKDQKIIGDMYDDQGKKIEKSWARDEFNETVHVGSHILLIGNNFLSNCPALTNLVFDDLGNISKIGNNFLMNCELIEKITCNNLIVGRNKFAFDLANLFHSQENPKLTIGENFLANCKSFDQDITFANKPFSLEIKKNFLFGCESFNSDVTFHNSIIYHPKCLVAEGFLHNCKKLVAGKVKFYMHKTFMSSMFDFTSDNEQQINNKEVAPIAFGTDDSMSLCYRTGIQIVCNKCVQELSDLFPDCNGSETSIVKNNYRHLIITNYVEKKVGFFTI